MKRASIELRWLRLWIATKLLAFVPPCGCLVRAVREDGSVEWDGGMLMSGTRIAPCGLSRLVDPDE